MFPYALCLPSKTCLSYKRKYIWKTHFSLLAQDHIVMVRPQFSLSLSFTFCPFSLISSAPLLSTRGLNGLQELHIDTYKVSYSSKTILTCLLIEGFFFFLERRFLCYQLSNTYLNNTVKIVTFLNSCAVEHANSQRRKQF